MADWVGIKHAVNSSLGTGYFTSLDRLLGCKLIIRGFPGMEFTVYNGSVPRFYPCTITENDEKITTPNYTYYMKKLIVEMGVYSITIPAYNGGGAKTISLNIDNLGATYILSYDTTKLLQTITANTTYTLGNDIIYISARGGAGGGGAGGAGGNCVSSTKTCAGGGGGGYAGSLGISIDKQGFNVSRGTSLSITIGTGGTGGVGGTGDGTAGSNGGATIIGNLITLSGGNGGSGGKKAANVTSTTATTSPGGTGGNAGGIGTASSGGIGGKGSGDGGGNGGAGGSGSTVQGGNGIKGQDATRNSSDFTYKSAAGGGGGGGARLYGSSGNYGGRGGAGGNGIGGFVRIYGGVYFA